MAKILILKNPGQNKMLIDWLGGCWTKAGHEIVTRYGIHSLPEADVVVLHVDLTKVPWVYRWQLRHFPLVINRNVNNISKRKISDHLIGRDEAYTGPVIIKTNLNFGGAPETGDRSLFRRIKRRLRLLPNDKNWRRINRLNPLDYPIFDNKTEVPAGVWSNQNLIVQRFMPEREGDLFYVRYWSFFGDVGWAARFGSKTPIAKYETCVTEHVRIPIPKKLVSLRKEFGLDYGRFDYVEHEGKLIILDVNKTLGAATNMEDYQKELEEFAQGINGFVN